MGVRDYGVPGAGKLRSEATQDRAGSTSGSLQSFLVGGAGGEGEPFYTLDSKNYVVFVYAHVIRVYK